MIYIRFIFSGGIGAALNLGILWLLTSGLHVWYLTAAVASFVVSYSASFVLQKFWTFQERSTDRVHAQAGMYLAVALVNLGLNTLLMYLFVSKAGIHYLIAQAITSALIAVESYFLYRYIFKERAVV